MKAVDMSLHVLVWCGLAWPHARPPSTKEMIGRLERNEAYVSWLQPRDGRIEDQFPAIRVEQAFYTLSLRMMKAVWRHVRLKKGFVNRQAVPHVGVMLRIPTILLAEKIRTQERFNVAVFYYCDYFCPAVQPRAFPIKMPLVGRSCGPRSASRPSRPHCHPGLIPLPLPPRLASATCSGSSARSSPSCRRPQPSPCSTALGSLNILFVCCIRRIIIISCTSALVIWKKRNTVIWIWTLTYVSLFTFSLNTTCLMCEYFAR